MQRTPESTPADAVGAATDPDITMQTSVGDAAASADTSAEGPPGPAEAMSEHADDVAGDAASHVSVPSFREVMYHNGTIAS